jgi:signal transduction histidine kinase
MPALVGLLVVVFSIAGLLVYEAWHTGESRREIAERGLQDYASYAAWSTARAGDGALSAGLATLFRGVAGNRLGSRDSIPSLSVVVEGAKYLASCECAVDLPADYYFTYDARSSAIAIAPPVQSGSDRVEPGWASAKVGSFAAVAPSEKPSPDLQWLKASLNEASNHAPGSFGMRFVRRGDSTYAIGLAPQREKSGQVIGAVGFVTSAPKFATVLLTHLWRYPTLLPQAITRGMPSDSLLAASVTIPGGEEIYRSKGWVPPLRSDTASLSNFSGGLKVRVSLRPDAIVRLQGGVVPVSRVPVWVGLLLLTALLTTIIVRNLQREHELARLRLEFSASVSHELRTPLAQILLFGETLTLGRTRTESERIDAASVIVREARRLMHLVDNTLAFSRAERPVVSLSPKRVRLAPIVNDVIEGFAPLASVRNAVIRKHLDEDASAFVDPEAVKQILINLLDNAVKYGPAGQEISVGLSSGHHRIEARQATPGQEQPLRLNTVRLTVDDQGPGVSGRAKDEIWVPFARGRNGEGATGTGCGLGLSVVRDLAERHNGKAWVDQTPAGHGARFVVEFPDLSADDGRVETPAVAKPILRERITRAV